MTARPFDRQDRFVPPDRPPWLHMLNDLGDGIDKAGIVPLDPDSMIARAVARTGLDDFGDPDWREPFDVLMRSIDAEADLHLGGRILTSAEIMTYLEARLRITDHYRRFPETEDEIVDRPVLITGFGRSGTTILFQIMSLDPQFRVGLKWESMFPVPPPEAATYRTDPRIAKMERLNRLIEEMVPEFRAIHKLGGQLPVEALEFEYSSFLSDVFTMLMNLPTYAAYLARQDQTRAVAWQKRIIKLLQSKYKCRHWLLKSPSHLQRLDQYLALFPDMRVVFAHRDPVVSADSVTSFIGTLQRQRTDRVFGRGAVDNWVLAMGEDRARLWNKAIGMIGDGTLAPGQYANFHYDRFVTDPLGAIRSIYDQLGMILEDDVAARMQDFLDRKPKDKFGRHEYEQAPPDVIAEEREAYRTYQDFFGVQSEI